MKKKLSVLTLLASVLAITACGGNDNPPTTIDPTTGPGITSTTPTTETTSNPTPGTSEILPPSSETTVTPPTSSLEPTTPVTPPVSTEPIELTMTLELAGLTPISEAKYKITIGEQYQLNPVFNDPSRAEEVTYTAIETPIFGSKFDSDSISIDENGVLTATKKTSNTLTVTATSISGLTSSITLTIVSAIDNVSPELSSKLLEAVELEKNEAVTASYIYENSTGMEMVDLTWNNDGGIDYYLLNDSTEKSGYSVKYNDKYYSLLDENEELSLVKAYDTKPSTWGTYPIKVSAFNTVNGFAEFAKYVLTDTNGISGDSASKNAVVTKSTLENNDIYDIYTEVSTSVFGEVTKTTHHLELYFKEGTNYLLEVDYTKEVYQKYVEGSEAEPNSSDSYIIMIDYVNDENNRITTDLDVSSLFYSDYTVVLTDENGVSGNSFGVESKLTFAYGEGGLPETANAEIDKLSVVSSSNTEVASIDSKGVISCLKEGTTTLTFTSAGGVTKTVELIVTFDGITDITLSENVTSVSKLKVGESITGITAQTTPYLASQPYTISISEGSDYAAITKEENGYTLTGVAAGVVTIKAETVYNGETISTTHQISIYAPLTDAQIKEVLIATTYRYTDAFGQNKGEITFDETSGNFEYVNGFTATFDYTIENGLIVLSNVVSSSTNYTLNSLVVNDDVSEISANFTNKSAWGSYSYTYTYKKVA